MKIANSPHIQASSVSAAKTLPTETKELTPREKKQQAIRDKLKGKFGDKIEIKKQSKKKTEAQEQSLDVHQTATVGKNDPNSDVTKDKLREILKTGGFDFSQKERKTLANILQ